MTRWKLTIEYDGTDFVGWQRQDNGYSVQQALEEAVLAFSGESVEVQGAGRTDSGVHASGQAAHLDLLRESDARTLRDALNFHLKPHAVAVLAAEEAPADFHARFSAKGRKYLYRIVNRRAPLALDRARAWFVPRPLDIEAMALGADRLVGRHDFTSFRAAECQAKSPEKTLDVLSVLPGLDRARAGTGEAQAVVEIVAEARSFLHHQVRNMVGSLKLVGEGKWTPDDMTRVLAARDRRAAGPTAPPDGLYLTQVVY